MQPIYAAAGDKVSLRSLLGLAVCVRCSENARKYEWKQE